MAVTKPLLNLIAIRAKTITRLVNTNCTIKKCSAAIVLNQNCVSLMLLQLNNTSAVVVHTPKNAPYTL